ncbi:Uncharacterized protein OBRU01_23206 [Operophtera brumata]|uniref:Uncharacterized protein n=1 Tax=Operophtera brumata TaxID=104452 RepID=A0A0L7KQ61_OPEBR|nr:Uncharacterized protein OBRU01_23206 [Operophtera brumata]
MKGMKWMVQSQYETNTSTNLDTFYIQAFLDLRPETTPLSLDAMETQKVMQQWVIWVCGAAPLAVYIHTRPRPEPPPLMIWSVPPALGLFDEDDEESDWITTNPWQRREMGPYGYYLNRPPSDLQSATTAGLQQLMPLRRAFSDSNILIKEPPKRKRHSKSI